jgi:hypothetical protein
MLSLKKEYITWKYGGQSYSRELTNLIVNTCKMSWRNESNANIDIDYMLDKGLDVSFNPNIDINFAMKNKKALDWDFVSMNESITIDDIINYPDLPWKPWYISSNPNVTIEFIFRWLKDNSISSLNWNSLSETIPVSDIFANPNLPWQMDFLSINETITLEDVLCHPEIKWDWNRISENKGITIKDIENNPDLPWNWYYISKNPNINIDFYLDHKDQNWSIPHLIASPGISISDVKTYFTTYSVEYMFKNPNIVIDNVFVGEMEKVGKSLKLICMNNLIDNTLLWNNTVFKRELEKDIKKRKVEVGCVLSNINVFYKDINNIILEYSGYN